MLTPAFELSQEPDFLILNIRVPYTRASEFDLYIDGEDLKFYAKPYFLRLTLPGRIVEDGREKASFDIDKGLFTLRVPKESPGEHFEGLDMLTSLLAPKGSRSAKPLVEDMDTCGVAAEGDGEEDDDFDWQVEQEVYMESAEEDFQSLQKYGFGSQRSGVFARLQEELSDVVDVKDPDGTTAAQRREERLNAETSAFSHDHYLLDLFEDGEIRKLLEFSPWWNTFGQDGEQAAANQAAVFSDEEKEQLRRLANRSYLLDQKTLRHVCLGLVDIILAYAYDVRITEGEHCVESAWNIRKVSGTLCWLETYNSIREVLVSFGRRSLCYPLYRYFDLSAMVIRDAARIFQSGKACVLKCLLDVHKIFRENDPAYILNDLYITDYCVWIQKVKSKKVVTLAEPLCKAALTKDDLELDLVLLEKAAIHWSEEKVEVGEHDDDDDEEEEEEEEDEEEEEAGLGVDGSASNTTGQRTGESSSGPLEKNNCLNLGEKENLGSPSHRLIQELQNTMEVAVRISEHRNGKPSTADGERMQGEDAPSRTLLEVSPRKNPLLIVAANDEGDCTA